MAKLLLFLLLLSQCMVGPNYKTPQTEMPASFAEQRENTIETGTNSLCQWWKQFNDPILDQMLEEAIISNFDVRIAIEKIEQARAQYRIEKAHLWPEFDVNAMATRSRNSQDFFNSAQQTAILPTFQNFFQIGFDAVWELDFFGKFRRSKNAAYYSWEATKEEAQDVLISVLSEIALKYASVRCYQEKINLIIEKIALDEKLLLLTDALFQTGLNSQINTSELLSILENDKAALPPLYTSLKTTIYAIGVLLGKQPELLVKEFEVQKPIPTSLDKVPIGLPSDLLRRRPDIKKAERELAAATELIGSAIADLFPHIALTGNTFSGGALIGSAYGFESASLSSLFKHASSFFSIGPNIFWNAIDFGRTRAAIAVQTALQQQALLRYEKTVIYSLKDVEGALIAYFEEQKREYFLAKELDANEKIVDLYTKKYTSGLSDELTVLYAKRTAIESSLLLTDSKLSLTGNLIGLYKTLGGDWACSYSP